VSEFSARFQTLRDAYAELRRSIAFARTGGEPDSIKALAKAENDLRFYIRDYVRDHLAEAGMKDDNTVTVKMVKQPALLLVEFEIAISNKGDTDVKGWSNRLVLVVASLEAVPSQVTIKHHKASTDNQMLKQQVSALIKLLVRDFGWRHNGYR
jgi:hypothetical protein